MRGKLRAKERACHLSIFVPARGWLSLCEFELSLCLVDVNATHKLRPCVCVSLIVFDAFVWMFFCSRAKKSPHRRRILITSAISDAILEEHQRPAASKHMRNFILKEQLPDSGFRFD